MECLIGTYAHSDWAPGPEYGPIIFKGTLEGSPARRLLSDIIANGAWNVSQKSYTSGEASVGWTKMMGAYPHEVLADAMRTVMRSRGEGNWTAKRSDAYACKDYREEDEALTTVTQIRRTIAWS
jgi:hypothetical protein